MELPFLLHPELAGYFFSHCLRLQVSRRTARRPPGRREPRRAALGLGLGGTGTWPPWGSGPAASLLACLYGNHAAHFPGHFHFKCAVRLFAQYSMSYSVSPFLIGN